MVLRFFSFSILPLQITDHFSADKNENDNFRRQILNEYIGKQHRDLIIQCAEKQVKISKHIQLMLMLLGKFYNA